MNYCKGCGIIMQTTDKNKDDFVVSADHKLCKRCFRVANYNERTSNLTDYDIDHYLKEIKKTDGEVFLVIDVLNPIGSLVKNINEYISPDRITLLVNKVDILPKSIKHSSIIEWIDHITVDYVDFKNISLVSSFNKLNIDAVYDLIDASEHDAHFVGYSNSGKSSLIKQLFRSKRQEVDNVVSNSMGTTREIIKLELDGNTLVDYPGFINKNNIQTKLDPQVLDIIHPKKEIKIRTFQLQQEQLLEIASLVNVIFGTDSRKEIAVQFTFSNEVEIFRRKSDKWVRNETMDLIEVVMDKNYSRNDVIIEGLGIITVRPREITKFNIEVPRGTTIEIVESLYN